MKQKLTALTLAVMAAFALATPAFADVMWEPYGNDFYDAHRDECQYEDRTYLANGPEGYLTLMESPQSVAEVYNVPNGESVYVGYLWTDGEGQQWAVAEYGVLSDDGDWTWQDGWAPVSQLALVYDHISFEEDHGDELGEYDGSGDSLTEFLVYDYPGGPLAMEDSFQLDQADVEEKILSQYLEYLYTDENGLRWSKLGYYYGLRNVWVCLDAPMNADLGIEQAQTVAQVRGTGEELTAPAASVPAARTWTVWLIPAALVVLAAAVTALLVRRNKGKNSAKNK